MEEQVLFFTSQGKSLRLLRQMARTPARHLILVLPESLGRLQVNLFLRLVRRQRARQAGALTVVSSNRQARILAEQMGFASAATLDEARDLLPVRTAPARRRERLALAPASTTSLAATTSPPEPSSISPHAHLEHLLREGYLPNPAALPSLEEEAEAQRAAREEDARRSRLTYEIADERTTTLAQEESEEHEAQIIATILKTSHPFPPPEAPDAQPPPVPQHQPDSPPSAGDSGQEQESGTLRAEQSHETQAPGTNNPKP